MRYATLGALTLLLAGCMASRQTPKQYDLGEAAVAESKPRPLASKLIIREVTTPTWLRTRDMFYRLDYVHPSHPQRYATSEWIAGPGALLTARLRQSVAGANAGFTLSSSNDPDGYVLQTTLEEFTQAFTAPDRSECIVQLRASLLKSGDHIVAQRAFRTVLPAQTPDADGGAACLAGAADGGIEEIVAWLASNLAST